MDHEVGNTCSLWLARCPLATKINVSEGHVHINCAHHLCTVSDTVTFPSKNPLHCFLRSPSPLCLGTGNPARVLGNWRCVNEGRILLVLLLHNSCDVCTHLSDLETARVKVRTHLCKTHTHTHTNTQRDVTKMLVSIK